ncbi:alpha/beta hydrolase [Gillisia sp. CAL575]|uniref:alpha/beta hydrolase n=1 Tax=Gillisia sp. CAL575 TaxID=985255 RepID=UPI0003A7BC3C|nr:alpha/beta hydrolase [Gillisia sp. CAL575]
MKERLIILSDIWGFQKSEWINYYSDLLSSDYNIKYYDSCDLGEIEINSSNENIRHQQFINSGIEIAVKKLIEFEKKECNILAFSIGGTIAWKAALNGLKTKSIYAVSSTRLRYETEKPDCKIKLIFGEKDDFKPTPEWLEKLHLTNEIIENGTHQIYTEKKHSIKICESMQRTTTSFPMKSNNLIS